MKKGRKNQADCIVIPCYNEEQRLQADKITDFLKHHPFHFACMIDDGSRDKTWDILRSIKERVPERVRLLKLNSNHGKAEAVRQGFLTALDWKDFSSIGFLDADLAAPLNEYYRLWEILDKSSELKMVMGSRTGSRKKGIHRNVMNKIASRCFASLVSWLLSIRYKDTQCGLKILKTELAGSIMKSEFHSKWIFDVELLFRIKNKLGLEMTARSVAEIPLYSYEQKKGSKIKLSKKIKFPLEVWTILRSR